METRGWLASLCLVGLMFGCDIDPTGGDDDAAVETDGGAGGNAGQGGEGGEGGEGGQGGAGGEPVRACGDLDEARCAERDDCVIQRDVVGGFSACRTVAIAACGLLDAAQCDTREDCTWDGERCASPVVTCADHPEARACAAAGCFWVNDSCTDERPPVACDQPDPASCEAAGCAWTPVGCLPQCDILPEPACGARRDCQWAGDHCEMGPASQPCGALGPADCVGRADCTWANNVCADRPGGACDLLDEDACLMRADCQARYLDDAAGDQADPPEGGGGAEAPVPPLPPGSFIGCEARIFDCANVPEDACDRTPGCAWEMGACVTSDPDGCRQLTARQCLQNPRCLYTFEEICNGGGGMDGDFAPEPCQVIERCDPRPDAPPACGSLPIDQCFQRADCQVGFDPNCGGAGRAAPPPDGDAIIAPNECQICEPRVALECWDLDLAACVNTAGCRWVDAGGAGGGGAGADPMDPAAPPFPCDCVPGDPNCGCVEPPPPPGGFCEPDAPQGCWDFGQDACQANPGCEWIGGDQDAPDPIDPCVCDDAGNCACGMPVPGGGFCQDRQIPDPCAGLDEAACSADNDACEWVAFPGGPCDCPPGAMDCICPDVPEGGGVCVFTGQGMCQAPDANSCFAQDGCEWVGEGGCECIVGPDGQEICQCFEGGFCQPAQEPQDNCFALAPDACLANDLCMRVTCQQACGPDANCLDQCRQQGIEDICFPRAEVCPGAPLDICAQLDGCQVLDCMERPDGVPCDAEPICAPR